MSQCIKPLFKLQDELLISKYRKKWFSYKHLPYSLKKNIDYLVQNQNILIVPCSQCEICKNNKRGDWVERLKHEKLKWNNTYFVTLTYSNDNLCSFELNSIHLRNFIKYLRKLIKPNELKFFATGEYGSLNQRPHFHVIIFTNYDLFLTPLFKKNGSVLYDCELIKKCWRNKGYVSVGFDDNGSSFAYSFMYSTKSLTKTQINYKKKLYDIERDYLYIKNGNGFKTYLKIEQLFFKYDFKRPEFITMSRSLGHSNYYNLSEYTRSELLNHQFKENKKIVQDLKLYEIDNLTGEQKIRDDVKKQLRNLSLKIYDDNLIIEKYFSFANKYSIERQKRKYLFENTPNLSIIENLEYNKNRILEKKYLKKGFL